MLRMNLATRPFYNERLVHLVLATLALVALAVLMAGGLRVRGLVGEQASLIAIADRDELQAREVTNDTIQLRRNATDEQLEELAEVAAEANRLIDQRIFSWTEFLNHVESTLPPDVMLTSLRPAVDATEIEVMVGVVGQSAEAIDRFIDRLEDTGAFADLLSREEEVAEDGTFRAVLLGRYERRDGDGTSRPTANLSEEGTQ